MLQTDCLQRARSKVDALRELHTHAPPKVPMRDQSVSCVCVRAHVCVYMYVCASVKCGFIWTLKKILEVSICHSYRQSPRPQSLKPSERIAAMRGNETETVDEVTEKLSGWMAHWTEMTAQKYPGR